MKTQSTNRLEQLVTRITQKERAFAYIGTGDTATLMKTRVFMSIRKFQHADFKQDAINLIVNFITIKA